MMEGKQVFVWGDPEKIVRSYSTGIKDKKDRPLLPRKKRYLRDARGEESGERGKN